MLLTYTDEQHAIFDELMTPTSPVIAIKATAGSSKTTSLVQAIKRYKRVSPDAAVRYLVFGALNAEEARREFGTNAIASTLHSYAHANTVKQFGLGPIRPFLTWSDVPKSINRPFGSDSELLYKIEEYCKSDYLSLDSYVAEQKTLHPEQDLWFVSPAKEILNLMAKGAMPCTHNFYLKLFHVLVMNGTIQLAPVDRLLVDEFQDMSGLAIDIVNAIPAEQKVFVGDDNQAVFTFLNLQNGFAKYPEAKQLHLTKSFRVDQKYAPAIQQFLRRHLESDAVFIGMEYPVNSVINTHAYITRTNSALISKMISLDKSNTPYHLSSKVKLKQLFKLPLALIYAKPAFVQKDAELAQLQHDIDDWGSLPASERKGLTLFKYLRKIHPNNTKLLGAITLVSKHTKSSILSAYANASTHINKPCSLTLLTGHVSKGATFDSVELDSELNEALSKVLKKDQTQLTEEDLSEYRVYFVCCTRHRHQLLNATHLNL